MSVARRRLDRRTFLQHGVTMAGGAVLGTPLVQGLIARGALAQPHLATAAAGEGGYGPLVPVADQNGNQILALPEGFKYITAGVTGTPMSDGNPTPKAHDGMAAFRLRNGNIRLVRNHEARDAPGRASPIGNATLAYDRLGPGGTTSLEFQVTPTGDRRLVRDFVSLNGTIVNCSGGPTPWGSWLTCEESTQGPSHGWAKKHGYVYEVSAAAKGQVRGKPIPAMGRFVHEAVAVDPASGFVYETEDNAPAGLYRYLPNQPGNLRKGGRLQMLAIAGNPNYDTRTGQQLHQPLPVTWVNIPNPDPAAAETAPLSVYNQGAAAGGAIFARLEGCFYGAGSIFVNSTSGGDAHRGQVWEYRPGVGGSGDELTLLFESTGPDVLDSPDNMCVSPRGGIVLCEDGSGQQYLRGLTRTGEIFDLALNLANTYEWAGSTFSPDGQTLFANVQGATSGSVSPGNEGMTFAIWGPWSTGAL